MWRIRFEVRNGQHNTGSANRIQQHSLSHFKILEANITALSSLDY